MGGNEYSRHLLTALDANQDFKSRGFDAVCGPTGGVVIERGGHARGVWHYIAGSFYWTPAGHSAPVALQNSVADAVAHTLTALEDGRG